MVFYGTVFVMSRLVEDFWFQEDSTVITAYVDMRSINFKGKIPFRKPWQCVSCWLLPKTILVRLSQLHRYGEHK